MPSSIGHAAMAIVLRPILPSQERNAATIGFAAAAAVALDIDAIGRPFGGGDVAFMGGHRAITHSVTAAVVIALTGAVVLVGRRRASSVRAVFPYLTAVIMSHGLLDMLTAYGEGVQLLAPFSTTPFASPWKPFIGVLLPEILILWVPALLFFLRPRMLPRVATLALASVATGLTVGLLGLTSPYQISGYLSILGERRDGAARFDAESTRRLIAAAEATSPSSVTAANQASRTASITHQCVAVSDSDIMVTSGEVTAGGWHSYRGDWVRGGGGTLWWRTTRPSVEPSDTLRLRAIRLDRPLPPGAERGSEPNRIHLQQVARTGDTLVFALSEPRRQSAFRSGLRVPTPGRWLLIATMEDQWGCFIFDV